MTCIQSHNEATLVAVGQTLSESHSASLTKQHGVYTIYVYTYITKVFSLYHLCNDSWLPGDSAFEMGSQLLLCLLNLSSGKMSKKVDFPTTSITNFVCFWQDIAIHDPSFHQFKTLSELYPNDAPCFMLGNPHYGCQGKVSITNKTTTTLHFTIDKYSLQLNLSFPYQVLSFLCLWKIDLSKFIFLENVTC